MQGRTPRRNSPIPPDCILLQDHKCARRRRLCAGETDPWQRLHYAVISRRAGAFQNCANGFRQDSEVEAEGPLIDVFHIGAHPLIKRVEATAVDLPQAGDSGLTLNQRRYQSLLNPV